MRRTRMSLDVESILYSIGVEVLRESGDEVLGKCPMHLQRTGKEDAHPSWSINSKTYVHHCFSCGYAGTLTSLYRDLVGEVPDDLEWELSKKSLNLSVDKPKQQATSGPTISEWSLGNYSSLPEKLMLRRNLRREAVDFFEIKWDSSNKTWVIPIRTPDGELMGFQFRQKGIVINHPVGMEKSTTLFGFHKFKFESKITIVESPLDAVRLYGVGIPAVSSFGAAISTAQMDLLGRHFRYVVSAMDNDAAGHRAKEALHRALEKRGCVVFDFNYRDLDAKDPGDVESDSDLYEAWKRSLSLNLETK
jgi:DNA primase